MTHPILPLSWKPLLDDASFCIGESNNNAFQWIQKEQWPHRHLNVYGPKDSGKTHLGTLWAKKHHGVWLPCPHASFVSPQGKYILDLDPLSLDAEETLGFLEEVQVHKASCLWLSTSPFHTHYPTPNLHSRLVSFICISIEEPDDILLLEVLKKAFRDVGLIASLQELEFLVKRMERSFFSVREVVEKIHQYILEHKAHFSIPTIKTALNWNNGYVKSS